MTVLRSAADVLAALASRQLADPKPEPQPDTTWLVPHPLVFDEPVVVDGFVEPEHVGWCGFCGFNPCRCGGAS